MRWGGWLRIVATRQTNTHHQASLADLQNKSKALKQLAILFLIVDLDNLIGVGTVTTHHELHIQSTLTKLT